MFKKIALFLLILVAAFTAVLVYSLRDNPARPVIGVEKINESRGFPIQYFINGPEKGETLVLQASYARSGSDFNELIAQLNAAGYRTLIMQARGVEGTGLPTFRATLFDFADDLAAVLDAEAIEQPITIIGHAFGNRIARAFSSRYPQPVRSLILLAAGDNQPPPDIRNAVFKLLIHTLPEAVRMEALEKAFFAPGNRAPEYWLRGWYPSAGIVQGGATANTEAAEWIHGGLADMLVVQPQYDAAAKQGADKLIRLYPNRVKVSDLDNAGHAILPEQLKTVSELILTHLEARDS